ncbi:class I SAM-dependent methyltransferase [Serratia rubidaea]|uniref:class I SAM-dependent methyltransferase n=1 Tax=Serratia rubidaea TaxID=61652 RepID=UPI0022B8B284|nr:class I SAM-dependent methyltransferase [Serratia rubidaea]WBF45736.1 methyltransferase domain-containing protein [Serratia rubidaea]
MYFVLECQIMFNGGGKEVGKRDPGFIQTFSRIAPVYEEKYAAKMRQAHDACAHAVRQSLNGEKPLDVLDIGCGTGVLLEQLYVLWPTANYVGLDPAAGMVAEGEQRRPFASFIQGRAESIPLPTASVDLVVCSMSFGHWRDKSAGLREVRRVLKSHGVFCLVENAPAGWGLTTLVNWLLGSLADYRSEKEVLRLAYDAGLRNIDLQTDSRRIIVATFSPDVEEHG